MTKRKSSNKAVVDSSRKPTTSPVRRKTTTKPASDQSTKHARLIAMLQGAEGATIAKMMKATGWQQHSVRGFLAGIVRKKLKLNLVSEVQDSQGRVYRIVDRKDGKSPPTGLTQAA